MSVLSYTPEELDSMNTKPETPQVPIEKPNEESPPENVELKVEKKGRFTVKEVAEEESEGEATEEEDPPPKPKKRGQKEMFVKEKPERISKKTGKPIRKLTEKQLDNLAAAREKGLEKRRALKKAKEKEAAIQKAEKTRHIRARKKKQMDEEALIMAHAEEEVVKAERNAWDEERLVSLMNKTLDTYMTKREKKKQLRTTIPAPPEGYLYYPGQPPQRITPKVKKQMEKPKEPDPYAGLFGMD
jgi:hypothetical protein